MTEQTAVVIREPVQQAATTPQHLLSMAVQQGANLEQLERLMALQERWEANEARKAYVAAMAAFKAEPIRILKDRRVSFDTKSGLTEYNHATLGNVVQTITQGLAKHGLSHSWDTRREADRVHVSCKITHALGHSESIELDAGLDTSGSKNNIQAMGSTITYLQRYTLLAITGLATEEDDDGRGAGGTDDKRGVERVSPHVDITTLPYKQREFLAEVAATIQDVFDAEGPEAAAKAWKGKELSADEAAAAWSLLKSPTRSAMKKAAKGAA